METDETVTEHAEIEDNVGDDGGDNEHISQRGESAGTIPEVEFIMMVRREQLSQILELSLPDRQSPKEEAGEESEETEVTFYTPSGFDLTKCCKKLNISYDQKANQLWATFNVNYKIKSYSNTIETIPSQPMGGFQCLSTLFTGSPDSFHLINLSINNVLCETFQRSGKYRVDFTF